MAATLCPNCDNVINNIGCQACGWKRNDVIARDYEINPRVMGATYGPTPSYPPTTQKLRPK